jgi:hypothetical protein
MLKTTRASTLQQPRSDGETAHIRLPESVAVELENQLKLWFDEEGFKHLIPDDKMPFALGLEELYNALKVRLKR